MRRFKNVISNNIIRNGSCIVSGNSNVIMSGNKTIVNGHEIEGNFNNVTINNGKIYLDGKLYTPKDKDGKEIDLQPVNIIINGNVDTVRSDIDVTVKGNTKSVSAGRDVEANSIEGNVSAGRDVDVEGSIKGNVNAGRDITSY